MALSATEERRILDEWVDDCWLALHTDDEGNEPTGQHEVDASDYERQEVDVSRISGSEGPAVLTNAEPVVFTRSTTEHWGIISHGSLWTGDGEPRTRTIQLNDVGDVPTGTEVVVYENQITIELD